MVKFDFVVFMPLSITHLLCSLSVWVTQPTLNSTAYGTEVVSNLFCDVENVFVFVPEC